MKPEEDAYGQFLLAYVEGRKSFEVIERDDGFIGLSANIERYFSSYDEWTFRIQKAMDFVKGYVLDIGCGAGRHALYLQEKGFRVLGVDNSPLAIQVCKQRGVKETKVVSIEELCFEHGKFNTILMLGNNFGLFGGYQKARELLTRFHRFSADDCLIIAETLDPYETDNPVHLEYHDFNLGRGRMGGQIRFRIRFSKYSTSWFDYLFASRDEVKKIVDGTGWKVKEFIDSESASYVVIIEKVSSLAS